MLLKRTICTDYLEVGLLGRGACVVVEKDAMCFIIFVFLSYSGLLDG